MSLDSLALDKAKRHQTCWLTSLQGMPAFEAVQRFRKWISPCPGEKKSQVTSWKGYATWFLAKDQLLRAALLHSTQYHQVCVLPSPPVVLHAHLQSLCPPTPDFPWADLKSLQLSHLEILSSLKSVCCSQVAFCLPIGSPLLTRS